MQKGSMYVCEHGGEWLWWSPARVPGEAEVQSGRVHPDEEGTWKGDEMGLVGGRAPTL